MSSLQKLEGPGGLPGVKLRHGTQTAYPFQANGGLVGKGAVDFSSATSVALPATGTGAQVISVASANALAVGANGTTNPVLNIDSHVASVATGISITGAAAGSSVALAVLSSGTNENINIDAKGSGSIYLGAYSTGVVTAGFGGHSFQVGGNNVGSATHFLVGPNTTSNPVFNVDDSTANSVTGINIKSAAAAGGLAVTTTSSGTDESLTIAAKGAGGISFNPGVVATAGGKVSSGINYGSLAVGLYTGTGAPSFSAMNGSIYTDSEATTTTTRIYVNKSGAHTAGTTWTNLTTAA